MESIEKNEKSIKKLPILLLPKNPTKDDYISHLNKLELHLDLTEKIKNQYINFEKEVLKTDVKPLKQTPTKSKSKDANSELRDLLLNKVYQNKLLENNAVSNLSQSMLDEMYLSQILNARPKKTIPSIENPSTNTMEIEDLDSLHSTVIDRIVFYEENAKRLKSEMHTVSEKIKKRTHIQLSNTTPNSTTTQPKSTNSNIEYNSIAINVQNILRTPKVKDKVFTPHFDQDNKLIEDRKGFISAPLKNSQKAIRYETTISNRNHDGIILKSTSSDVHNVSQGIVSKIGTSSGNKKFIIIKHDNGYMSVYSNINQTYVTENEFVKYNQKIGEAHKLNNQDFTIHFQLWKGSKSQNPSHWLKNN